MRNNGVGIARYSLFSKHRQPQRLLRQHACIAKAFEDHGDFETAVYVILDVNLGDRTLDASHF
jgi:hypothetical protein